MNEYGRTFEISFIIPTMEQDFIDLLRNHLEGALLPWAPQVETTNLKVKTRFVVRLFFDPGKDEVRQIAEVAEKIISAIRRARQDHSSIVAAIETYQKAIQNFINETWGHEG